MATVAETEEIKRRTAEKPAPSSALQAGGHGGDKSMLFEGARCLKPALAPKERAWYESLAAGTLHPLAAAVAPRFYGVVARPVVDDATHTTRTVDYLVLENTTFGMAWFATRPSFHTLISLSFPNVALTHKLRDGGTARAWPT